MDTSPENNSSVLSTIWRSNLQCRLQENAEARLCVPLSRDKSEERGQIQPLCSRTAPKKTSWPCNYSQLGRIHLTSLNVNTTCANTRSCQGTTGSQSRSGFKYTRSIMDAHLRSLVFLCGIPTYLPLRGREALRAWSISLLNCWDVDQQHQHVFLTKDWTT